MPTIVIYFWLHEVQVAYKKKQTFIPKMGDRVFLDMPKSARYLVVSREFVYNGDEVRVDLTIVPSPKIVAEVAP